MTYSVTVNGKPVAIESVAPTTTVLEWLRSRGQTGTKEGCAEGDCGACTIGLLDHGPHGPTWRAVCSCIMLLPQVFGRKIVTVEGLAINGDLHPAQDAMVKALGSQCGYCTPGFVMTLFEATYRTDLDSPWKKDDQICGNLCRCTGYRPIRDALELVAGTAPQDDFSAQLMHMNEPQSVDINHDSQRFVRPVTWSALWDALDHGPARFVSGATDLGLDVTQRFSKFPLLIELGALPEIRQITSTESGWRIGAGVLLADLESWTETELPAMSKMLRFFASRQIKNRATVGGNLCNASPIGDLPPVMMALDAVAVVRSRSGERRVPFGGDALDGFWTAYRVTTLQPGEVLAAIEIPRLSPDTYAASYKVSKRRELDISAVAGAFAIELDDAGVIRHVRLAFGGMAATPARARRAEKALLGKILCENTIEQSIHALKRDFTPIDDHRGSAWYRGQVAANLMVGFFDEARQRVPVSLPDRPTGTVFARGSI